jgi:N-acetylglucosamine-6-phosphate deacetylase
VATCAREIGIPLDDALRMATLTPAETIGRKDLGRIARGATADLVALDRHLRVAAVWQGGERIA